MRVQRRPSVPHMVQGATLRRQPSGDPVATQWSRDPRRCWERLTQPTTAATPSCHGGGWQGSNTRRS